MFTAITSLLSTSLQQLWPALTEALTVQDLPWVRKRFGQVLLGSTALLATACAVLVLCGQSLATWWVGQDLTPSMGLLLAFAVWTVYAYAMSQCSVLLNAASVVRPQVVMAVTMTLANIPLSIVLTQHLGLAGPLLGSLIAHLVCAGVPTAFLVRRVLRGVAPRRLVAS
jgi:O-antigen/teichoic acid export membrane protein